MVAKALYNETVNKPINHQKDSLSQSVLPNKNENAQAHLVQLRKAN